MLRKGEQSNPHVASWNANRQSREIVSTLMHCNNGEIRNAPHRKHQGKLAEVRHIVWRSLLPERFGSGDGERQTLLTRQIPFEPLPASVLFGLLFA
jgi:hypothetical protein